MTLKELTLENFAAVGERRQKLAFGPITLLFGPNGAGKSSILKALRYVRNVLTHDTVDPADFPEPDRDLFGPYQTLVHAHDRDRTIRIRITADVAFPSPPWLDDAEIGALSPLSFALRPSESGGGDVTVELAVRWSHLECRPYLAEFSTEIDGQPFATVTRSPDLKRVEITELNVDHTRLVGAEVDEDDPDAMEAAAIWAREVVRWKKRHEEKRSWRPWSLSLGRNRTLPPVERLLRPSGTAIFSMAFVDDDPDYLDNDDPIERNPVQIQAARAVARALSAGILLPLGGLKDQLDKLVHLGPLRTLPPRRFEPRRQPARGRWHDGEEAWHLLPGLDPKILARINAWLGDKNRLDTRYQIEIERFRELPALHPLMAALDNADLLDQAETLRDLVRDLPEKTRIKLRDIDSALLHQPADVAVGISQLLPVIVCAIALKRHCCVIEQPELHVHPAIQVRLGDLLIERAIDPEIDEPRNIRHSLWDDERNAASHHRRRLIAKLGARNQFLIETHSEHLILRLLRRVRETAQDRLPPGATKLNPEHIAVAYVEPRETGAVIKRLRVNEEGDFIDRWPKGFFDERDQELFDLGRDSS